MEFTAGKVECDKSSMINVRRGRNEEVKGRLMKQKRGGDNEEILEQWKRETAKKIKERSL